MEIASIWPKEVGFDCLASSSILIKVDAVSRCGCDYKELINEEEYLLTDF